VHSTDTALLMIRLIVGLTMVAHGLNHVMGGGRIAGTADWFESLGLRPGRFHAWMSVLAEVGCGLALAVGFLTPLAAGGLLGTMAVAGVIEHRGHGFFVFRNGFEYVLMIAVVVSAIAISSAGRASADNAIGFGVSGWVGFAACVVIGLGGTGVLLGAFWRPGHVRSAATESDSSAPGVDVTTRGDQ
jgi:putative oxidoreductase